MMLCLVAGQMLQFRAFVPPSMIPTRMAVMYREP